MQRRHELVHSGEKPFRCPADKCIRGFAHTSGLRSHILQRHANEPATMKEAEKLSSAVRPKSGQAKKSTARRGRRKSAAATAASDSEETEDDSGMDTVEVEADDEEEGDESTSSATDADTDIVQPRPATRRSKSAAQPVADFASPANGAAYGAHTQPSSASASAPASAAVAANEDEAENSDDAEQPTPKRNKTEHECEQ